jgi:hypothetical protein
VTVAVVLTVGLAATVLVQAIGVQALAAALQLVMAKSKTPEGDRLLDRKDVERDLRDLAEQLETRFSYLRLRGVDHRRELAAVLARLPDPIRRADLCRELVRFIALFGDGHAQLQSKSQCAVPEERFAPFLVGEAEGRFFAAEPTRKGLVDPAHPWLEGLDGIDIRRWVEVASRFRGGTPQRRRRAALGTLARIEALRAELGLPPSPTVVMDLRAPAGDTRRLTVPLVPERPRDPRAPTSEHRILDGNVGYLKIGSMQDSPAFAAWLVAAMADLRETRGLVIDVRENSGGSRLPLRTLFPYFMASSDQPRIANVAKYRLTPDDPPGAPDGYLADRFLYPKDASVFSAEEKEAIARFAARFEPEWNPPAEGFSEWHYFVLSRRSAPGGVYHYQAPVVVLVDDGSFSATDVFAGAFKGWRNTTIMGVATAGGSGRPRHFVLPRSDLSGRFSSMASFQPSGLLYDGHGIEPDVLAAATRDDWFGASDTVLQRARQRLAGEPPSSTR